MAVPTEGQTLSPEAKGSWAGCWAILAGMEQVSRKAAVTSGCKSCATAAS